MGVFQAPVESEAVFVTAVVLAVIIIGGYGLSWNWTGFKDNNTLWDWLHLTILPITLGSLAFWLKIEGRSTMRSQWWWFVLPAALFTVLIIGGYVDHWSWTGFPGNKLWDWLHLLVLPIVLVLLPYWIRLREQYRTQWQLGAAALLGVFVILTIGGYALNWTWTGFPGNKLWDWLELLLVPFVVPVVFIYLRARMDARRRAAAESAGDGRGAGNGWITGGGDASPDLPRLTARGWLGPQPPTPDDRQRVAASTRPPTAGAGDVTPCPHCGRSD